MGHCPELYSIILSYAHNQLSLTITFKTFFKIVHFYHTYMYVSRTYQKTPIVHYQSNNTIKTNTYPLNIHTHTPTHTPTHPHKEKDMLQANQISNRIDLFNVLHH